MVQCQAGSWQGPDFIVSVFNWNAKKEALENGVQVILVVCDKVRKMLILMRGAVLTLHESCDI
jgi:hypothetical protein